MYKKKILICGDSFAADWSVKYKDYKGWTTLLSEQHIVTNAAQAGVSQFKIYKQVLQYVSKLDQFDYIIVHHTSPYRVPTMYHPIHEEDPLHKNADLIYADIEYHAKQLKNIFNSSLKAAEGFYNYHYDEEFYVTTSQLYRNEIQKMLIGTKFINLDLNSHKQQYPGLINHLSEEGNKVVYNMICNMIK